MGFLKKVLKVVAIVAAVALAIPSGGSSLLVAGLAGVGIAVSAIGATAIVAGLTIASGLLNKPKTPAVSPATTSRLNTSIDPRTPRKMVFGRTAMAVDIRDMEYTGTGDEFLHYFLVNAAHAIDGYEELYFDDKLAWSASGGITAEFLGYLGLEYRNPGLASNVINISPRMGTTRRYTGLSYTWMRFKRTGNTKKAESPFSASIPSRITIIGRGMRCYDPRQDFTVTGGSGPHRSNDQSTWTWGEHCRNPPIQLLNYLIGYGISGRLSVGKGIPISRLHLGSFMTAANACDEPINLVGGGTQPRYRTDGIFSEADDMGSVIDAFKAAMSAEVDDSDGRFAIRILVNDLDDPIAHFGPDDFLGGLTWSPVADISSRFNVIRGQFVDPRPESLYQMVDYPEVAIASVDGIERAHAFPLALVQDSRQAQRTAKQLLQRQQYSGLLEVQTGHTGWRVQKYDIVQITHPPLGFYAKLFRVAAMSVGTHGQVQFTLREENEAIYAWDEDESPAVQPAAVTTYNPSNNPIVAGIDQPVDFDDITGEIATDQIPDGLISGNQEASGFASMTTTAANNVCSLTLTPTSTLTRWAVTISGAATVGDVAPSGTNIIISCDPIIPVNSLRIASKISAAFTMSGVVTGLSSPLVLTLSAQATASSGLGDPHTVDIGRIIVTRLDK